MTRILVFAPILFLVIPLLCLTILLSGQQSDAPETWQSWLQVGQRAYKNMRYDEAAAAFQKAIAMDSGEATPHLFLASTLMAEYNPSVTSQKNLDLAQRAEAEYSQALSIDAENKSALQQLASLCYEEAQAIGDPQEKAKKIDVARSWYERLVSLDPDQKEPYYWLGVIAWSKYYPVWISARNQAGMKLSDPGPIPDATIRQQLKDSYGSTVATGLFNLEKALHIDPKYDDAMTYMSLLIRARADLAETPEESQRDAQTSYEWAKKAHATQDNASPETLASIPSGGFGNTIAKVKLVRKVEAMYPAQAQAAGVLGTVKFRARIGRDGRVQNLELVSGHPLLVEAARQAARQWQYEPAVVNGQAVESITQAEVKFLLPVR